MVKITIDTGDDQPKKRRTTVFLKCAFCNGSGHPPADPFKICPVCQGQRKNEFYYPPKPEICGQCRGNGRHRLAPLKPCPVCEGTGFRI